MPGISGHYEGNAVVHIDHAEIRIERREVIVRNFRVRVRGDGQERRFADIRETDQTDIRQKLQLENDLMLLARETCLCKARDLAGRCGKMLIAPAAAVPLQRTKSSEVDISRMTSFVSASRTTVPRGTF